MNSDIDETNNSNIGSTSSSTPQKQQQRRRAFFHDDVIVTDNKINSTIDINEENLSTGQNNNEDNPTNKSFKRKVVSFSAMPFEKKVADSKKNFFF
jgi:hypothetical protein